MNTHWRHDFEEQLEFLCKLVDANREKHPCGAAQLERVVGNLGVIGMRFSKILAALQKENDDLKAQLAQVPPKERWLDDADISAADAASTRLDLDANGDPNPQAGPPPTDAELAAKLKASQEQLNAAIQQNQ